MFKALSSSEQYSTKVVGASFCQENLIRVCGPKRAESVEIEVAAELVLENANQADESAVAVFGRWFKGWLHTKTRGNDSQNIYSWF